MNSRLRSILVVAAVVAAPVATLLVRNAQHPVANWTTVPSSAVLLAQPDDGPQVDADLTTAPPLPDDEELAAWISSYLAEASFDR